MLPVWAKQYKDYSRSLEEFGVRPFRQLPPIRPNIGDDLHILVFQYVFFSMLSLSNTYTQYLYSWGKYIGEESTKQLLQTMGVGHLVAKLGAAWKGYTGIGVLKDPQYVDKIFRGWEYYKIGTPRILWVDETAKTFRVKVNELMYSWDLPNVKKRTCFLPTGILGGSVEAVIGQPVNIVESECKAAGKEADAFAGVVQLHEHKFDELKPADFKRIRQSIYDRMFEDEKERHDLDDYANLALTQAFYLGIFLSSAGSHALFYWIGRESGKEIGARLKGDRLKGFCDLFEKLKIGHFAVDRRTMTFVLEECAFCSGVKNMNKRLCSYVAGMIAGYLENTNKKRFTVVETKCIGSGDKRCEFVIHSK